MKSKIKKHHILLSLGIASASALPVALLVSCGDSTTVATKQPSADEVKINAAREKFTNEITTQTLTAPTTSALAPGPIALWDINHLSGIKLMPDISKTGASVAYNAEPLRGLVQIVTATISAGTAPKQTVKITLNYAAHVVTGDEKIQAAVNMFTNLITTQTITETIDHPLDHTLTSISRETINQLAGIKPMPDTSSTGATVTYRAAAPNAQLQVVTASITAPGGSLKTVRINLTYAVRVLTDVEKVQAAYDMFTDVIKTQTLTATIDSKLDETASSIDRATINLLAGINPMPDTSSTGATVTYHAAASVSLVQVVTATITAGSAQSKTVSITLTFKPHVPTDAEKIQAAHNMFTSAITTQTISATITNKLDETATSIPVATINALTGITHMPDISGTGATVTYTATAPNGLVQVVTATISAGTAQSQTVSITLTFQPHVPTDAEKIQAAHNMFTSAITTQTISATITNKLDETATSIPVATINALTGITHMPDISGTGATVTYTATAPNGLVQVVTATITAGTAQSQTVSITLTFQPHVPTDAEKIQAAADSFTPAMKAQTLTVYLDQALAENETSATVIDAALVTKLPASLPSGVSIAYHVGAVDRATLIQNISVTISAGTATSNTFQISLTYAGITLAAFKAAHPSAISADGLTILDNAFSSASIAADFLLPETVTTIGHSAFSAATFVGSFHLPSTVTTVGELAFERTTLPTGFTLPAKVATLGTGVFKQATLPTGFVIPPLVVTLESQLFYEAHLPTGFAIPSTVTAISIGVFSGVTLPTGFTIPNSVTSIGPAAFAGAEIPSGFAIPATTTITDDPTATLAPCFDNAVLPVGYAWRGSDGHLIANQKLPVSGSSVSVMSAAEKVQMVFDMFTDQIKTQIIFDTLVHELDHSAPVTRETINHLDGIHAMPDATRIGATVTYTPSAASDFVQSINVVIAADGAQSKTLTVTLTYSKISLADFELSFPGKISTDGSYLKDGAFISATVPDGFVLPNTVTRIGFFAFHSTHLPTGFTLPPGLITIGREAFQYASLPAGFVIPPLVTTIEESAFKGVTLPAGFTIPPSVTALGITVFEEATIPAGFTIPPSITFLPQAAFHQAHLPAGFTIPLTVNLGPIAFRSAKLPPGYEWHDANGQRIANQDSPTAGCTVAPI